MTDVTNPGLSDPKAGVPTIRRFKGATSQDQGVPPFTPDCNGAASNNHFVEFINRVFSVYDKQTGKLLPSRVTDVEFWVIAGITSPGNIIDPRIVFIPDAGQGGQWLAVQIDLSTRGRVLIATTDPSDGSADPMVGRWKAQEFELRGLDFPMLGYDAKGVYIGVNSSQLPPPPPPTPPDKRSPQFVFIPRAKALAYPPQVGPADIKIIGPLHFEDYGDSLYPAIDQSGGDSPYGTLIGIDNLSRTHLTYSLFSPQSGSIEKSGKIEVAPFEPVPTGNRVSQPDAYRSVIWANDGLVAAPVSDGSNVWLAQTHLRLHQGELYKDRLAVRWYRLSIDPQTRVPRLASWGDIFQPYFDYFNPSILPFGKDDYIVVSVSRSGWNPGTVSRDPNDPSCGNLGAYVALIREADPTKYTLFPLQSGLVSNYVAQGGQRWGDYSTICRDSTPNTRRAWIVNQFALQEGQSTSQWGDIIAAIDLPLP